MSALGFRLSSEKMADFQDQIPIKGCADRSSTGKTCCRDTAKEMSTSYSVRAVRDSNRRDSKSGDWYGVPKIVSF
jgi:hypothetical protein